MHARGRFLRRVRLFVAAAVVAAAVPLAAAPAAADPPSTEGRIVFMSGGLLLTMAGDGADVVQLTTTAGAKDPTWSPDGTRVAFARANEIWTINADGTGERRLTTNGSFDSAPTWSPDGRAVVFAGQRENGLQLIAVTADGTGETALTSPPSVQLGDVPAWSPDGATIAFRASTSSGLGIYAMRPDGSGLTRLTFGNDWNPTWSPDGSTLYFARFDGTNRDLYRISATGTALTRLTATPAEDEYRPALSPDGTRLLYDSAPSPTGARRLMVADPDGTNPAPHAGSTASREDGEYSRGVSGGGGGPVEQPPGTGSGSTSAGQTVDLAITSPASGAELPASADPLPVSGTVALSASSARPYHAAYVVDVSGSTTGVYGRDCDGSGSVTSADDLNSDGWIGDILDCEIGAVIALNAAVAGVPSALAGVVALGGGAVPASVLADVSPAAGDQGATPAGAVATGETRGHVETVLRSMRVGMVQRYTHRTVGSGTDYDAALERMNAYFLGRPDPATNVAYFMSDGEPNVGTFTTTPIGPLQMAVARGTHVHTFAVGTNAGGCGAGQPLQVIASRTGGTCTAVSNPALLSAAVATPATLERVDVHLDSGTPVTAVLDGSTTPPTWTAELPGGLPPGSHTLTATARTSDGSAVTATSMLTGLAAPVADAGGPYTVDEGSRVALAGTVSDADGGTATAAWTPADLLTGADTLAPTYAGIDDDEVTVTLTATDEDGLAGTDTATITTANVAPALGSTTLTPQPATGTPFELTVPFTDPGTEDTHTATIDWGDGTVEAGSVDGGSVTGEHTYATGGQVTITVTVTDDDGGTATTQTGPFRVNTAPTVTAGGPYAVDEGSPLTLAGSATDPDGDPLTVAWAPADRVADPSSPTSAYDTTDDADEVLTLSADDGDLAASAQAQVTVRNVAPALTDLMVPSGVVPPGSPVELTASYTDPGTADTHAATIDWGDGTVDEAPVTGGEVRAQHTYAAGGSWTVTLTVSDDDGGSASLPASVVTNRTPVVNAGTDLTVDEGSAAQLDATATDPDGDPLTLAWSPAGAVLDATVEDPQVNAVDDGATTLTLTATDPHGATTSDTVGLTVRNVAPTVASLVAPATATALGNAMRLSGTFTDPGSADTHTARVDWGDGTTGDATVDAGALTATRTYAAPGVYTITVQVTDDDGGAGTRTVTDVVVYDRNGRFVTGGGSFASPAGAVPGDPTATGKASFTASALYVKSSDTPVGVTKLDVAGLRFTDTAIEWLVVSGSTATYRGTGTLATGGALALTVTATDGGPGGGEDRIRIKIWNPADGAVVYDNGGSALTGGSIVVHR